MNNVVFRPLARDEAADATRFYASRSHDSGVAFLILYQVDDDVVFVLAVAHEHRRPGYWRERTP